MTTADWGILIPVIITFLTAATGYLKAHTAQKTANRAEQKADDTAQKLNGLGD